MYFRKYIPEEELEILSFGEQDRGGEGKGQITALSLNVTYISAI